MSVDRAKIEQGVRLILEGVGEDPGRGGLRETPSRVARMYEEILGGIGADPTPLVTVVDGADFDEMIMVRDIPLSSLCEHHMIPFNGKAHVAYVPNRSGQITGLSKVARVVDVLVEAPAGAGTPHDRRSPRRSSRRCRRAACSS